jgi:Lambda phage tail tape-measure protein (Tape_meas_lam_C)
MADTAALVVALSAQLTKFEKDMKGAVDIANRRTKEIENSFTKMNAAINNQLQSLAQTGLGQFGPLGSSIGRLGPIGLSVAAGIGVAVVAFDQLSQAVKEYVDQAGKLRDAADTTGLTIVQLKELSKIGLEVGVSGEQVEQSIGKMTVAIDALRDAEGPLFDKLKKFPGVLSEITSAKDAAGAIDALATHFGTLGSAFEKNAFLKAVFGRGGLPFGRVLQQVFDAGGLKALEQQAIKSGKAIDDNMVKAVDDLADRLAAIKKETSDLWGEAFGSVILQAQIEAAEAAREVARGVKQIADNAREGKSAITLLFEEIRRQSEETSRQRQNQPPLFPTPLGPQPRTAPAPLPPSQRTGIPEQLAPLTGALEGRRTVPDILSPKTEQTLAIRIKLLKEYIAVMGEVVSATKKQELAELELEKAVEEGTISRVERDKKVSLEKMDREIENLEKYISAAGRSAGADEVRYLATLKLQRAATAGQITSQQQTEALRQNRIEQELETLAVKERVSIASEEEIARRDLLQIQLEATRAGQAGIDMTNAEILAHQRAKEAIQQREAALSKLPETTRYAQQAMDSFKNADQVLTSFAGNVESAFGDIATGSKTAAEAFKSLADSIIRDLVRMTIRMAVTGPILKSIGELFPAGISPTEFGNPFGRQHGGPVRAGSPYVVGEHGPELFVPRSSGQIVPNQPTSRGGTMGGTAITINNYTARDTETRQSSQQGPNGERIIIDIVKKAQARGELDDVNRGRFGLRPAKVR